MERTDTETTDKETSDKETTHGIFLQTCPYTVIYQAIYYQSCEGFLMNSLLP